MKFEFLDVMLAFLLYNLWVRNAGTHQTGLQGGHGRALVLPAFWFAKLQVEPKWTLIALLHARCFAQSADHVADVHGASVVVGQHIKSGRFAVH
eukprot:309173-Pleurochrysis_carterae.AAC.1